MKSTIFLCFLFSLLLFVRFNQARKAPEEYWKSIMEDQPIPDAIKGLFLHQHPMSDSDLTTHFAADFDTKTRAIIYHSHGEPARVERHEEDEVREEKKYRKQKITSVVT